VERNLTCYGVSNHREFHFRVKQDARILPSLASFAPRRETWTDNNLTRKAQRTYPVRKFPLVREIAVTSTFKGELSGASRCLRWAWTCVARLNPKPPPAR
jgi:hypothetical protein